MTQRRTTPLVAACALLLGTAPLLLLFNGLFEWLGPILLTVAAVVGTGHLMQTLRRGPVLRAVSMAAAMALMITFMFGNGGELLGFIPTGATFEHFRVLLEEAGAQVASEATPVNIGDGLKFLVTTCVGLLALINDLLVACFNASALTGLSLLLLYIVAVAVSPQSVPWVLFIPGAIGYLWLLLTDNLERIHNFGRRFSSDGKGIDRWEPSPLATTGRRLALVVILAALVVPSLLPGVSTGLIDSFYNPGNGSGGSGDGPGSVTTRVDPVVTMQGSLEANSTTELAVVSTDNPDPGYMKMWVASTITADGFQSEVTPSDEADPVQDGIDPPRVSADVPSQEWTATFNTVELNDFALPLYGAPTSVDIEGDWVYDPRTNTVTSPSESLNGRPFTYTYTEYEYTPELLRRADVTPRGSRIYQDNTTVPENRYVADLVDDLTAGRDSQYDKVMAIHDHFARSNGFSYELSTEEGWSGNALIDFLENKEGFCQQYAGAMAWMVRQAGIPARVAIGLTRGNIVSDGFRVTNFNYHAWVEVYFHGYGWVPFDPTPSSNVRTPTDYEWAPDPDRADDSGPGVNPNDPADPDRPDGDSEVTDPSLSDDPTARPMELTTYTPPLVWLPWVAGAVSLIALFTPFAARSLRRKRRLSIPQSRPVDAAANAWRELTDTAIDLGWPIDPTQSPRTLAAQLIELTGPSELGSAGIRHLAAAEEQSRYAPRPPDRMTLRVAYRAARWDLCKAATVARRLRADLLPPTLLWDWRNTVTGGIRRARYPLTMAGLKVTRRNRSNGAMTAR